MKNRIEFNIDNEKFIVFLVLTNIKFTQIYREGFRIEYKDVCGCKKYSANCDHYMLFLDEIRSSCVESDYDYLKDLHKELAKYNQSYQKVLEKIEQYLILL